MTRYRREICVAVVAHRPVRTQGQAWPVVSPVACTCRNAGDGGERRQTVFCPLALLRQRYGRHAVVAQAPSQDGVPQYEHHLRERWYPGRLDNACR